MFSEPTINFVTNLSNAPGLEMELAGATVLAFAVVCYLARVAWIALSYARRMEQGIAQATAIPSHSFAHTGPYCAG